MTEVEVSVTLVIVIADFTVIISELRLVLCIHYSLPRLEILVSILLMVFTYKYFMLSLMNFSMVTRHHSNRGTNKYTVMTWLQI